MSAPVVSVRADDTVEEAATAMVEAEVGSVPVLSEGGQVVGILTERDYLAREESIPWALMKAPRLFGDFIDADRIEEAYERIRNLVVEDVMSQPVHTVDAGDPAGKAAKVMVDYGITHVPVVDGDRPIGIVTNRDLLKVVRDA